MLTNRKESCTEVPFIWKVNDMILFFTGLSLDLSRIGADNNNQEKWELTMSAGDFWELWEPIQFDIKRLSDSLEIWYLLMKLKEYLGAYTHS